MTKEHLEKSVAAAKAEIQAALQTIYGALNPGQQKQLLKDEKVKALFDLYKVTT